jgi:hypothetical protein
VNHISEDVCNFAIDAVVPVSQAFVVEAEKMEHRGVSIVAVSWFIGHFVRPFVASAIAEAALKSAACEPCRMVSSSILLDLRSLIRAAYGAQTDSGVRNRKFIGRDASMNKDLPTFVVLPDSGLEASESIRDPRRRYRTGSIRESDSSQATAVIP